MEFDQVIDLLTALGDFGALLDGAGTLFTGLNDFSGSVDWASKAAG